MQRSYWMRDNRLTSLGILKDSVELLSRQHAMLLYANDAIADTAMIKYVNEALKKGHLVVYIPISFEASKMASEIENYEENVKRGNLFTLKTTPFYESAIRGSMDVFEELKIILEEVIQERNQSRKDDKIILHFGCAADLTQNDKFEESMMVEKWWQSTHSEWMDKGLNITLLCPHSNTKLKENQMANYKEKMASLHTITKEAER
jgi:hypothetical protein